MSENPTGNFETEIPIKKIETPESFNLKEINESLSKLWAITLEKVISSNATLKTKVKYLVKFKWNPISSFPEDSLMGLTEDRAIQQILALDKAGNKIDPTRKQALENRRQEIAGSGLATAWEGRIKTIPGINVNRTGSDFRITSDGSMKLTAQVDWGKPIADDGTGFPLTNITQLEVVTTNRGNPKIIKTIDQDGKRCSIICSRTDGLSETRSSK